MLCRRHTGGWRRDRAPGQGRPLRGPTVTQDTLACHSLGGLPGQALAAADGPSPGLQSPHTASVCVSPLLCSASDVHLEVLLPHEALMASVVTHYVMSPSSRALRPGQASGHAGPGGRSRCDSVMGPTPSGGRFGPGGPPEGIEWVL